jgi:segregation and condensation protein A
VTEQTAYRVELEQFSGPLDLLIHLLKEDELEAETIPVATVCDRYLEHLGELERIDLDAAGDFLVMASILLRLKAQSLLPGDAETLDDDEDLDPRFELVRQLVQYRRFKQVAEDLRERRRQAALRLQRGMHPELASRPDRAPPSEPLKDASVEGLYLAFSRLLRETELAAGYVLTSDDTPLHVHVERLGVRLPAGSRVAFRDLFEGRTDRSWVIGVFLALLELMKRGRADVLQADGESDIVVTGHDPGPGEEAAAEA